jgi:hypothetical protein
MFNKAVEWDMMEQNPFAKGKSLHLKENNKRTRFLNEEEIERLLDALGTLSQNRYVTKVSQK